MAVRDAKRQVLKEVFGYETFRPGQEDIIDALLAGTSVLAVMPTGSGKSLCYQVPALVGQGLTIVVSPLVALMKDQVAALQLLGVEADTINSSRDRADNVAAWRKAASGELRLLYMSPERLMTERMLAALARLPVRLFAVDEAHCISQWGASFRPEYEALSGLRAAFPGVPIAAFTATADEVTRTDILQKLFGGSARQFVHGFDRPNIHLAVTGKRDWKKQLLEFLSRRRGESGIVYCLSRVRTEKTAAMLSNEAIRALPYHAGLEAAVRAENQNIFMTEKGVVMVATIAFGMGIDKPDVRFVCHVDLPGSLEAYYQEIGRAGRDGRPSEAFMIFGLQDLRMRRTFIDEEHANEDRRRREHRKLDALMAYCEAPECRRAALLGYFGEPAEPCGNCDICQDKAPLVDGTAEARNILSTVHRTGERTGPTHLVDVLRGTANDKVVAAGHDRLPTFGVGAARKRQDWQSLIRQLTAAGHLQVDMAAYGGLSLTDRGRALLQGEGTFSYRADVLRPTRAERHRALAGSDDGYDEGLLTRLKSLRLSIARERSVPAYVVFTDRTLIDMARRQPRTRAEFAEVHGVGDAKLAEFAEIFLAEIAAAA